MFVSGLAPATTEQDIAEYFGSIGIVKVGQDKSLTCSLTLLALYLYKTHVGIIMDYRLTRELANPRFGCTKIKFLGSQKVNVL